MASTKTSTKTELSFRHRLFSNANDDGNESESTNNSHQNKTSESEFGSSSSSFSSYNDDDDELKDDEEFHIESLEEDDNDDDSDDESVGKRNKRKRIHRESNENEQSAGDSDDDDDDDEYKPSTTRNQTVSKKRKEKKIKSMKTIKSSESSGGKRRSLRSSRNDFDRPNYNDGSGDDDDDDDDLNYDSDDESVGIVKRKSSRKSAQLTNERILKLSQDDSNSSSANEEECDKEDTRNGNGANNKNLDLNQNKKNKKKNHIVSNSSPPKRRSRLKKSTTDDSDYDDNSDHYNSEDSGLDNNGIFEDSCQETSVYGDDDMSFEDDVEESDDDGKRRSSRIRSLSQEDKSPVRRSHRRKQVMQSSQNDDEKSFDRQSIGNDDDLNETCQPCRAEAMQSSKSVVTYLPRCSSCEDSITMEALPKVHICYLSPDGTTRSCFKLETLYKASMMQGIKQFKKDGTGIAFLQPPHFRTIMDDRLIDQIASRFGRKALIIEDSHVYKEEHETSALRRDYGIGMFGSGAENDYGNGSPGSSERSFSQRLERYLNSVMGNGDLYCCCVCYSEAHRRFRGGDESDDDSSLDDNGNEDSNDYSMDTVTSSKIDPMTILGGLDDDEFKIASTFCFKNLSRMKQHLRSVHRVDTSNVQGSDLYQRFMIRAQDGLLQNHLRAFLKSSLYNSAMRTYWAEGHNQSFILLRILVERRQVMETIESEEQQASQEDEGDKFSRSFMRRGKKIWSRLMAPYRRDDEDVNEFIADDDNIEECETTVGRPVFEKPESDLEDQFAQHLREKRLAKRHGYDTSSNEDDDSFSDDKSIAVVDDDDEGHAEEEEESEDEWVADKLSKSPGKNLRNLRGKKKNTGRLKKTYHDGESDDDDEDMFSANDKMQSQNTAKKQNNSFQEGQSDDDDDDFVPPSAMKRKKQIFYSDEE